MDDSHESDSPEGARARRERAILEAVQTHRGAAVLVAVNMNSMKAFNAVAGHALGDQVLKGVEAGLARLGIVWRTGGDEFVALVAGDLTHVRDLVRGFTWLYNVRLGATDAWEFRFADGRPSMLVPVDHIEVVCSPRCGLAEVGQGAAEASRALELARHCCYQASVDPGLHTTLGFAPLVRDPWSRARKLAAPGCPVCKFDRPTVLDRDLGEASEECPGCGARYQRIDKIFVLGKEDSAGFI